MASAAENSGKNVEVEERSTVEIETENRGAAYKYGLVGPYLEKFAFEDKDDVPNSEYYSSDDEDIHRHPNAHEVVKRFLKQVRESNGYDVDCCPPPRFFSPFVPRDPNTKDELFREDMMRATHFAIDKINVETGKTYELVQVEKAIHTTTTLMLLTFSVKEVGIGANVDASHKTLRAMVEIPYSLKADFTLEEWMFKSLTPDTAHTLFLIDQKNLSRDVDPDRKKAKIGDATSNLERLGAFILDNKSAINLSHSCKAWASRKKSLG